MSYILSVVRQSGIIFPHRNDEYRPHVNTFSGYVIQDCPVRASQDPFLLDEAVIASQEDGQWAWNYFLPLVGTSRTVAIADYIRHHALYLLSQDEVKTFFLADFPDEDHTGMWVETIRSATRMRIADWWIRNVECAPIASIHGQDYRLPADGGTDPFADASSDEEVASRRDWFLSDYLNGQIADCDLTPHVLSVAHHHLGRLLYE